MLIVDDSDLNADWIKTGTWDLPTDPAELEATFGPDWYATLSRLPAWRAAPPEVKAAGPVTVVKFAPGLRPVLKHGDPSRPGYAAMHPNGRAGRGERPEGAADEMTGYAGLNATTAKAVTAKADELGVPVRAVEAEFERRLELAKTMPDPYQPGYTAESGGMVWYSESTKIADRIGDGDTAKGAGILAALSAQNPWPSNITAAELVSEMSRNRDALGLTDAETAWAHYQSVQKAYGLNAKKETGRAGGTGPVDQKAFTLAWRIASGESPPSVLTGRKRRNFYNNILGDTESVTVDVHMMKALSTTPGSKIVGKKAAAAFWQQAWDNTKTADERGEEPRLVDGVGYTVAAQAVINVARRRGLDPRQVQAIIWNTCVNEPWKSAPGSEASDE